MKRDDLVIRVAGEAGEGVLSTGQLITQAAARAGYGVLTDSVPPAEIKGGHSFFQIRLSDRRLYSRGDGLDVLLAFNQEAFDKNIKELRDGGLLLFDSADFTPPADATGRYRQFPLPLTAIAKQQLQFELGKNVVAVGAVAALSNLPMEYLTKLITERFARKGHDILDKNLRALEAGRRCVEQTIPERDLLGIAPNTGGPDRMVLSGNTAVALGALVAGCRRYAGYPITPATDIMEFLASELPKVGGAVVQAEDEIAAIGMVLGASFAGQKAMTATSGPGLSLMSEMLGLASMAELPAVVVDCQRAGPSTGMPTRHEQGDLNLAVYGGHGELQRIVLAPVSVVDCFWQMINAFNAAERYQVPVVVLSDTVLAVRTESIPAPDLAQVTIEHRAGYRGNGRSIPAAESGYLRYRYTGDGISPMSTPGVAGGQYVATGLEHNEAGRPRYDAVTHADMTKKRFKKLERIAAEAPEAHRHGDSAADIGVITWGSTWGVVVEAVDQLASEGVKIDAIAPRVIWPIPDQQVRPFIESKRVILVPEVSFTGQYATLLSAHYQRSFQRVSVYGGQPFKVADIIAAIHGVHQHAR
ncbi:MAG: 2-oxoacid:acceptor oxidoreductase subunit alpha [Chloroflexi bacterium]|nr:2-oxoacid:acceptor oxidoreductase subunit alpha [Chloroflexota bacterium]